MSRFTGQKLYVETPEMFASRDVQSYVQQETARPCKQWVVDVINGCQESECVKLRTIDFLLLPDTERVNRYWRIMSSKRRAVSLNWLAIATGPGLASLRDLRGRHVPMLKNLLEQTQRIIFEEAGLAPEEVMAYVHYPPSVYQLHIHFAHPWVLILFLCFFCGALKSVGRYAQHSHRDIYRIHSLSTVINNLEIDPDYYLKASLQISVHRNSPLHFVYDTRAPRSYSSVVQEGARKRLQ